MALRPYDVAPGDHSEDVKFVYKHALTTVRDTKRFAARRFSVPVEALDLVLGGRRLADERTPRSAASSGPRRRVRPRRQEDTERRAHHDDRDASGRGPSAHHPHEENPERSLRPRVTTS